MRRFSIAFFSVLALFVVLNAVPYFIASAPELRTLGLLSAFWRQDPTYMTRVFQPGGTRAHVEPQFYRDKFALNVGIALAVSFSVASWFQKRGQPKPKHDNVA